MNCKVPGDLLGLAVLINTQSFAVFIPMVWLSELRSAFDYISADRSTYPPKRLLILRIIFRLGGF